jgi:hypothetical protein
MFTYGRAGPLFRKQILVFHEIFEVLFVLQRLQYDADDLGADLPSILLMKDLPTIVLMVDLKRIISAVKEEEQEHEKT